MQAIDPPYAPIDKARHALSVAISPIISPASAPPALLRIDCPIARSSFSHARRDVAMIAAATLMARASS